MSSSFSDLTSLLMASFHCFAYGLAIALAYVCLRFRNNCLFWFLDCHLSGSYVDLVTIFMLCTNFFECLCISWDVQIFECSVLIEYDTHLLDNSVSPWVPQYVRLYTTCV
jgi:hypothetical protein